MKMIWTSVKDRLPNDSGDVLICSRGKVIAIGFHSEVHGWVDRLHTFNSEITHWMPLPEPSREGVSQ